MPKISEQPLYHNLRYFLGIETDTSRALEKIVSGVGGFIGIYLVIAITTHVVGQSDAPLIVASMGASAVLLFAAPHGKFSQPWNLVGGHTVSAFIGVACMQLVVPLPVAAALAVGISISIMYALRCIHPPGGATALMAVIGGEPIHALGYSYILTPVLLNALVIFGTAIFANAFLVWRRYPTALQHWLAETKPVSSAESGSSLTRVIERDDLEYALQKIGSYVDVTEEELEAIFELAQFHAKREQLSAQNLQAGHYYSNGEYGDLWAVRQIIDEAPDNKNGTGLIIYKIIAGNERYMTRTCTREEFARWARYEVVRNESSWQRSTR